MARALQRTISIPQGVALYMGAVVGAGILLLPGLGASEAGPASLVSWVFLCVLGVPLALTFAALAARTPDAGGVLTYATDAFGPAVGTVIGWYYWIGAATAQALVALTGAYYVAPHVGLERDGTFAVAAVILLVATAANVRGLRVSGRLQLLFSGTVATLLLTTIIVTFPQLEADNFSPFAPHGLGAIGSVGVVIFFAFVGWEAITHLSEEFRDPEHAIPRSTVISVALITVLFVGVAFATIGTGTYGSNAVNRTSIGRMLEDSLGDSAGVGAALIAFFISLGTANAFVAATSRLGYALSREGVFPHPLARLDRRQVPVLAVLVVGGWALLFLTVSYVARWRVETLLVVPNSLVIIVYLSATLAAVRLLTGRRRLLALIATAMCCVLLPFAGVTLAVPAVIATAALVYRHRYGRQVTAPELVASR
jgi:amino acid efflux transporter